MFAIPQYHVEFSKLRWESSHSDAWPIVFVIFVLALSDKIITERKVRETWVGSTSQLMPERTILTIFVITDWTHDWTRWYRIIPAPRHWFLLSSAVME